MLTRASLIELHRARKTAKRWSSAATVATLTAEINPENMTMQAINRVTFDSDHAMPVLGVSGRLTHRTVKPGQAPGLWFKQRWVSESRPAGADYPKDSTIKVEIRFDDELGNGHNTFAITATVTNPRRRGDCEACGCLHDDIARVFPELAGLIKWHLSSTDGPMHYVADTVYHASARDHNGRAKGEACAFENLIRFGDSPVTHKVTAKLGLFIRDRMQVTGDGAYHLDPIGGSFQVVAFNSDKPETFSPHYSLVGFGERWHEAPFKDKATADEWAQALNTCRVQFEVRATQFSEGKERNLGAARSCAVWPDATDEQLTAPRAELEAALLARLPAMLEAMRQDITAAGFFWPVDDFTA